MKPTAQRFLLTLAAVAVLVPRTAFAADSPAPDQAPAAEALFRLGREAAKGGDTVTACADFRESQRIYPAAGTLLNLADCEEREGKLVRALADLREVVRQVAADDPRARAASDRAAALEPRVPSITLELAPGTPSGARARLEPDGMDAPFGSLLRLDPGEHRVVVHFGDGSERVERVVLREGDSPRLVVSAPARAERVSPQPSPRSARRVVGFVLGGVGIASIAAGSIAGAFVAADASTYKTHCTGGCDAEGQSAASQGRVLGVFSPVALAAGVAAAGIGAYLVLTSHGDGIAIGSTTGGATIDWRGTF
jgi:hypothetical protein